MKCPYLHIKCPNRETHGELRNTCLLKEPWTCPYQGEQDELLLAEIASIITPGVPTPTDFARYVSSTEKAKEILAKAKQYYHPSIEAQKLQVELAKREERERIFTEGERFFHPDPPYTDIQGFLKWWQTLKEEK